MPLTLMHINEVNCSCGWSTSALVGRIYVRVYARTETDCVPSSTNAFMNLFSSIIVYLVGEGLLYFALHCPNLTFSPQIRSKTAEKGCS